LWVVGNTRNLAVRRRFRRCRRLDARYLASPVMKSAAFEVVVSALRPGDADSLEEQLRRAAIRVCRRRSPPEYVAIDSRQNVVFTAADVLEVVGEWLEQQPDRMARASIVVHDSETAYGLADAAPGSRLGRRRQLIEW
jgi:hypothetical protein